MKQKLKLWRRVETRPWEKIPKWLLPIVIILIVGLIYFVSQFLASIVLSLYALIRGWNSAQANNWLNSSVAAQFFYVLLFEGFAISSVWLILKRYGKSLKDIGLKKLRLRDGGIALIAYPAYLVIYLVAFAVLKHFFHSLNANQTQDLGGFTSVHGPLALTLTCFALVVFPPFAEEILFRGVLFEGFKRSMPVVYAGILTSVLFAAAHLPESSSGLFWVGAIDVFTLSLVLVYVKQKTKSLWPGIFLHAIKNMIAFVYLFLLTSR